MFERRLKAVLVLPFAFAIVLIARLYELQVAQGELFQQKADEALVAPKKFLPALRGRILDRFGRPLVTDQPACDVTVHYGVLSMAGVLGMEGRTEMVNSYIQSAADRLRRRDPDWKGASPDEAEDEILRRIAGMWKTLSQASGIPFSKFDERRRAICNSVEALRLHVWEARRSKGFDEPLSELRLREEERFHPVLRDIPPDVRAHIEVELAGLPFVRIEPSVRRVWTDGSEPLCHSFGTLGQVSPDRIQNDPRANDWLGRYRPGDEAGVSGIEFLCEDMLRGKRGYEQKYLDGSIKSAQAPIDGLDVQLTVDLTLQHRVYESLRSAIQADPFVTGGACVVLDVRTREVLALVSAPLFTQEQIKRDYEQLRDDTRYRPLLFRAISEEYQPGSIIKPVTLLAALRHNLIQPHHTVHCDGSYIAGADNWHCWTHWKHLPGHGNVNAVEAIEHSCNIYFYTIGERLHAGRLTQFFREFILGPQFAEKDRSITGMREERDGIIPTRDYLQQFKHRDFRPADGRNYAIGQGELQLTPLQAANLFATLATGQYRDPTLIANDGKFRPPSEIDGVSLAAWRAARNGLFNCVNNPGGTAYKHARLDNLEICGKTGSAQCVARALESRYTFKVDGEEMSVVAPTVERACEMLGIRSQRAIRTKIVKRWPPNVEGKSEPPTHAWFAGFAPYNNPEIAISVILEHGGGGGQTAGPVAREVFQTLLDLGYLKPTSSGRQLSTVP